MRPINGLSGVTKSAKTRLGATLAGLTAVALLTGCNSQDAKNITNDTRTLAGHASESLGNAQLATRVNSVLVQRKGIDMSGLHVETKDGVVTVSGHVRNQQEKKLVVETVDGTRGVDKVVTDDLRIAP